MRVNNKLLVVAVGTLALTTLSVQAAQTAFEEHDYDCEKENLEDSYACSIDAIKVEKQRLNNVYMNIYRNLSPTQKQQMDSRQMAWLKNRDAECGIEDNEDAVGTMGVWMEISANMCVANQTQILTQYYVNDFDVQSLTNAKDFHEIKREGSLIYYKGETVVKGTFNISAPDDDYTPCVICFTVGDADSHKIPREIGDDRKAWFGFDNSNKVDSKLKLRTDKCYQPIKATIKIKDYVADTAETETVDTTNLVNIISMEKPKVVSCA